jgi:RNA polymerase sigma-70 factor (ECF subfamily)
VTVDRHRPQIDSAKVAARSRIGSDACLTLVRAARDGRSQVSLDSQIELRAPQVHSLASALTLEAETSRLEAAIEELAEDHREVILLRHFEELSWAEVGQRLGRSEEAARKLFARAMAALTVRMTGRRPAD